ncbi:MAG: NAD(P)-dependent glycerol-3-phosphate dehydrogenase [Phycisphaerae bacterium]|nr:NAD(P)-dependent glycerol-3-phosphate dehydrogenase [Phycisphaerae bacterium]MDD5380372.1 NAD(P)-dependent glycerol-3-phosphate dehydrogenase [Phycisphaerae bacterium]
MFKNISIIGDGAMGTVLAMLLCEKASTAEFAKTAEKKPKSDDIHNTQYAIRVRMWGYDCEQLKQIESGRENKKFLPGYKLPENLVFESDDNRIMADADLIVSAVPCQFMREVWGRLKNYVPKGVPIVSVTKGIENDTLMRPSEILADVLGGDVRCVVLSGPTISDELARKLPATACVACSDEQLAKAVQRTFSTNWLRVYTNTDVVGVELAGAMKNIIAIAAGIVDGMGLGDNAKAALLSRGLAEITRLGVACGARPQTFAGLAGLGDLVTTCISLSGRNRSFGERIGKGQTVEQAKKATDSVIEGIATCESVVALGRQKNVEMPITCAIYEILFEGKSVQAAIADLMKRQLKAE